MRDDSGGKYQPGLLRSTVNRAKEAAAANPRPAPVRINRDLAHSGEIYHQAIAGAKAGKTVTTTADSGENSGSGSGLEHHPHVGHICATRDQAGGSRYHAVPNRARIFVAVFPG